MPRKMSGSSEGPLHERTNCPISADTATTKAVAGAHSERSNASVFDGMVFAFAGRFSTAQTALKALVEGGGGSCAASVTLKVTHVITTKAAVEAEKRSTAIATAIGRGLPLLHEDFIVRCVNEVTF